ncbi:MAG: ABC transporter ATP-binding protein [Aquitalea sp.]|nr:ABC transporter ATP-binding protein [Aquitalea sp.]
MLELRQVSLLRQGKTLVQPVSLQADLGQLCAILGPNGAGKSSLLQLMSGYQPASSGSVILDGQDIATQTPAWLACRRAVVEQHPACPEGWCVSELLATAVYLAAPGQGAAAIRQAVALSHCSDLIARRLETLSGGELQRVHLARALCQLLASTQTARYLLLDEATSALDFAMADAMMTQLRRIARELNIGVVAVMHDLNLALRHADQVLLLRDGCGMAFGKTADIMQKQRLEAIYGIRLAELISPDASIRAFVPHPPPEQG